jgi:hypothetical protein
MSIGFDRLATDYQLPAPGCVSGGRIEQSRLSDARLADDRDGLDGMLTNAPERIDDPAELLFSANHGSLLRVAHRTPRARIALADNSRLRPGAMAEPRPNNRRDL